MYHSNFITIKPLYISCFVSIGTMSDIVNELVVFAGPLLKFCCIIVICDIGLFTTQPINIDKVDSGITSHTFIQ